MLSKLAYFCSYSRCCMIDIFVKTNLTVVVWAALFSTNCVTYFVHFMTMVIQPNPGKKVLCKTSSYNFYNFLKLLCEMNMKDEKSFALGTKAGNCRTWPVKDADKREGGAASFETKVMVKLKKSVLTLETGSQREQILSIYVTFWALLEPKGPVVPLYRLPWLQPCSYSERQHDCMCDWDLVHEWG